MANERNVAALAKIMREEQGDYELLRSDAERLAARGVLVPAALTDEECHDLPVYTRDGEETRRAEHAAAHVRQDLERIAKGEA